MPLSPLAYADSLRVGTIEYVSPDEFTVLLDIESPDRMALNTGTPRPFPRINEYVLVPSEEGYLVTQVRWVTIERSSYPKRKGMQDFGLVDLPYPLRKMSLAPMGILSVQQQDNGVDRYQFHRGISSYPTVGDPVLIPTQLQLRSIIESGMHRTVLIGRSPLAANAEVRIDPDRLFGRHLAVLGNTGSGKSCSVAGLIRWSLEAAEKQRGGQPNARFIILDPNGEYANAFQGTGKVRVFSVLQDNDEQAQLQVPMWLWNSGEWATFTKASGKTQRPTLIQSLRCVRDGSLAEAPTYTAQMRTLLRTFVSITQYEFNSGNPWGSFPRNKNFVNKISAWQSSLICNQDFSPAQNTALQSVIDCLKSLLDNHASGQYPQYDVGPDEVNGFLNTLKKAHAAFGGSDTDALPIDPDLPIPFTGDLLLRSVEANAQLLNVSEHVETMIMRIRALLADGRLNVISGDSIDLSLEQWLTDYIGGNNAGNGSISVIDLSLVPAQVVQIVTAVIARVTLESLQRYRKHYSGEVLPTVLVMEEAHTFIKRYQQDSDEQSESRLCTETFEKIDREGRKFGLGLVLSSQRPSELSPTVLSQCNTFLLHRISNDRDQDLVYRLVPDSLHGLMRDLPVLPARQAILLGWASELPVLVEMNELPESQRPKSSDPDFWAVWSGWNENGENVQREVDWKAVADEWQKHSENSK